jgi:hypothetical protein
MKLTFFARLGKASSQEFIRSCENILKAIQGRIYKICRPQNAEVDVNLEHTTLVIP